MEPVETEPFIDLNSRLLLSIAVRIHTADNFTRDKRVK